jgi:two-component system OmpR family sensor kinase
MKLARPFSLRARLLWFLSIAILLTAVVQTVIAYGTAHVQANGIFDYHMQQMAMSLRGGLAASAPDSSSAESDDSQGAEFAIQVWAADGMRVFQSVPTAPLPEKSELGFSDVQFNGISYRVFSMRSSSQVIQVAQDMGLRGAMARTLALRTVAPILVMAPVLMFIAWAVVNASLAPVARVRRQLASGEPNDLGEVSEEGLPAEVVPLIRELNLLFARVRRTFDAQSGFVANAAHELRSPLAALRLQLDGLERAADAAGRAVAVTRLRAGIDRATRLVEQLLALARHQALSARSAAANPVRLQDIVRQAIVDAAPAASARGIDLGLNHADDESVDGNPEALRMLVGNLIDNAIKYTPEGGAIDVEIRSHESLVALTVEDSGPGIPATEREHVLDRFYRVPDPDTGASGSGLGLSIVKTIVDMHRAFLSFESSSRLGGLRVVVGFERMARAESDAGMPPLSPA